MNVQKQSNDPKDAELNPPAEAETPPPPAAPEIGGRKGPEPTRYGDWENGGKCVDF